MPFLLKAYLLKILRNFCLMRLREQQTLRHGSGEGALALEELGEIFSAGPSVEETCEGKELARAVSRFLYTLPETERKIFLGRYYLMMSIQDIAGKLSCSQSKVKTSLYRTRKKLQAYLAKEDLI